VEFVVCSPRVLLWYYGFPLSPKPTFQFHVELGDYRYIESTLVDMPQEIPIFSKQVSNKLRKIAAETGTFYNFYR